MAPHLYHITLHTRLHGQLCQNGYYFKAVPGAEIFTDELLMQNQLNSFIANVLPKIQFWANQQLEVLGVVIACISPKNGPIIEALLEANNGLQPDDALPSYCAGLISLRTGLGGRSRRGRSYYPGVSEVDQSSSILEPDSLARLQDVGDSLLSTFGIGLSSSLAKYGVWSMKLGRTPPTDAEYNVDLGFTHIKQCIASRFIATQRHRKIGHGT